MTRITIKIIQDNPIKHKNHKNSSFTSLKLAQSLDSMSLDDFHLKNIETFLIVNQKQFGNINRIEFYGHALLTISLVLVSVLSAAMIVMLLCTKMLKGHAAFYPLHFAVFVLLCVLTQALLVFCGAASQGCSYLVHDVFILFLV